MMIIILFAVLAVLAIPMAIYIYRWLKALLPGFVRSRKTKAILVAAACLLSGVSVCFFRTPGLILLHFWLTGAVIGLLCRNRVSRPVQAVIAGAVTTVILLWGVYNIGHPVYTHYEYRTDKPIRAEGYRIALLTDIHYDTIQAPRVLETFIPEINETLPDLVVLGGDIVEEGTSKERMQECFRLLSGLESSFGSYYIFGNHDEQFYSSSPAYTSAQLREEIRRNGICILDSSYVTINDELILAGLDDLSTGDRRKPLQEILAGADIGKLIVAADHQPNSWREHSAAGMDLQLSGHTHAGQIWPVGYLLELFGGLSYGRYDRDGITAIVSSGFAGWGYSIRTSERSEYVIIDILPAAK